MKRFAVLIWTVFVWVLVSCQVDPVAPSNDPDRPIVDYDSGTLTRASVRLIGSFSADAVFQDYGFELREPQGGDGAVRIFERPPVTQGNEFSCPVTIAPNTFYSVRSFISNGVETKYSEPVTFTAPATSAATLSEVSFTGARLTAQVLDNGGRYINEAGICWSTAPDPAVIRNNRIPAVLDAEGRFSIDISRFEWDHDYYFIAYAENSESSGSHAFGYSAVPFHLAIDDNLPVPIEDATFARYLANHFDTDRDDALSYAELKRILRIDVETDDIASMGEIRLMPNLTELFCHGSSAKKGNLTAIDPSGNPLLQSLDIHGNPVDSIDLTHNPMLQSFNATDCPNLSVIYVTPAFTQTEHPGFRIDNTARYVLRPDAILPIPDVHLRKYLVEHYDTDGDDQISVAEGERVTTIEVSTDYVRSLSGIEFFGNLTRLVCSGSNNGLLNELDVSHNLKLQRLDCRYNQLTELDVSQNVDLYYLDCGDNQLTELDVSQNVDLYYLDCGDNQLTHLDVSHNPKITHLYCRDNELTELDVSHNPDLLSLNVSLNQLTQIDVTRNPKLYRLWCSYNSLSTIDVSYNEDLFGLTCVGCQLISLDVSHNPRLNWLLCRENRLTTLDVSNNSELVDLECNSNPYLTEIWLRKGQTYETLKYDTETATLYYK